MKKLDRRERLLSDLNTVRNIVRKGGTADVEIDDGTANASMSPVFPCGDQRYAHATSHLRHEVIARMEVSDTQTERRPTIRGLRVHPRQNRGRSGDSS